MDKASIHQKYILVDDFVQYKYVTLIIISKIVLLKNNDLLHEFIKAPWL